MIFGRRADMKHGFGNRKFWIIAPTPPLATKPQLIIGAKNF